VANGKFERRFRAMETNIHSAGVDLRKESLESLDMHWRKAKKDVG
jgi:uncharacterized protein YabN with tetrapyrrole methylase and pyrophosphatase domain